VTQRADQIRHKFEAANHGLDNRSVRLNCSGRYLSEVRLCLDKNLSPRPCSADVRDTCRAPELILRPVR
jgi:ribonuclease T2